MDVPESLVESVTERRPAREDYRAHCYECLDAPVSPFRNVGRKRIASHDSLRIRR